MTIIELKRYCNFYLSAIFDIGELQSITKRLFEDHYGLKTIDFIMNGEREIEVDKVELDKILSRISDGEPIQYVLGMENFLGRDFYVDRAVLIPRPETEELVRMIIGENSEKKGLKILDIGTGSGAISVSLAAELKDSKVVGVDISKEALSVAEKNKNRYNLTNLEFIESDILALDSLSESYDIVVSNPPYVRELEREMMMSNVLDFEPSIALFVPDDDPLVFYKKITQLSEKALNIGGLLYFEINEYFGLEMVEIIKSYGFGSVELISDFRDRTRFVKATKI